MSLDTRELDRIVDVLTRKQWRVRKLGSHSFRAYPPAGGTAVDFKRSRHTQYRAQVYARFRRAGVELEEGRSGRPRHVLHPCTHNAVALTELIRQEPLPKDFAALDVNAVRWVDHADQRLEERGISIFEVFAAIAWPHITHDSAYPGRKRLLRGDVEVIWEPGSYTVISVIDRLEDLRDTPRAPLYYTKPETTKEGEAMPTRESRPVEYKPAVKPIPGLAPSTTAMLQFCDLMFEEQPGVPWHKSQLIDMFCPNRDFSPGALFQALHTRSTGGTLPENRPYRIFRFGSVSRDGRYVCSPIKDRTEPSRHTVAPAGTSGGVELTDSIVDRLAAEAEDGYDADQLHTRSAVPTQRQPERVPAPVNGASLRLLVAKWDDGQPIVASNGVGDKDADYMDAVFALLKANPGRSLTLAYHEIDTHGAGQVWVMK